MNEIIFLVGGPPKEDNQRAIRCIGSPLAQWDVMRRPITFALAAGILGLGLTAFAQTTAKDDIKKAGRETKEAAKDTGSATKKTAKKAAKKVKQTTNKAADKVEKKTRDN